MHLLHRKWVERSKVEQWSANSAPPPPPPLGGGAVEQCFSGSVQGRSGQEELSRCDSNRTSER